LTFGIVSLVAAAPIADASPSGRYLLLTFEKDESLSQNVVKVVRMGYTIKRRAGLDEAMLIVAVDLLGDDLKKTSDGSESKGRIQICRTQRQGK
jgi:hypothetical protein